MANLYDHDDPITETPGLEDIDVPVWIDEDITPADVAAIVQGGCSSGAYMPAVRYGEARETMNDHGDDVLAYLEDALGELPAVPSGESWSGIAVFYLSAAVELWASSVEDAISEALDEAEDEDDEPAEPGPGDYVLSDAGPLGGQTQVGIHEERVLGVFSCDAEARAAVRADMERQQFWPNVWTLTDHGNRILHRSFFADEDAAS